MKISTEKLSLEGSGEIRIPESAAALEVLYEVEDLQALSSLESLAGWSTQGKAHLSWNAASGALSSRLQGKLQPSHRVSPPFLAKELRYTGTLSFESTALLNLSEFEMAAPWGTIQGDASIDLPKQSLKGSWRLLLQDLGPLSPSLKGGHAEVRATVEGPFSALTLSAEVTARDLSVSELHFDTGHASLQAEMGSLTQGNIRVQAQGKELSLRGQTHFDLSDRRLNLTDILLEGDKSTLAGHLSVFLFKPVAEGELKAECNDLTALSSLIREKVHGSAVLQARFFPSEEGQVVSLLMEARNLEVRSGKALRSRVEAQVTPWASVPRGHITLEAQNGRVGDLILSSSAFILEGDLQKASFQLNATGHYGDPFEIKGSGLLNVSPDEEQVTLNSFGGQYGSIPFSLLQTLIVTHSSKKIDFGECLITLGSGRFQGSGWIHPEELSLDLRFDGVSLRAIPLQQIQFLDGVAHGSVQVRGNPASLEGTATLQVEKMRLHEKELPSAGLTMQSSLRQNVVGTTVLLRGLSTRPLELHVENNVYFSLSPLMLSVPPQSEIRGTLRGEMLLENISGLVELHEQKLSGIAQIDLALEGSVGTPRMTGWIHLKNGSYENLRTGTILSEIEADISARTPMLVVNRATATDGEKGRVSAQGHFEFAPGQGFPFKLDLALEKAKPFRYDSATAVVGGDLTLTGSLSEAMLTGQIRVDSAEFRIPERPAPEIQDLQVIEINKPGETQRPVIDTGTPRPWPLSLNLHVLSPGRVFLNGRGLDSEWQGELRIRGEATQPSVAGALSLVRGSVSFMGKRFELKKGSLFFDGSSPPSPTIDVEAESKSREITAYLHLLGPVQSLEIKLTSEPPFPPDEILSHLLFDRSASKITPPQAVQLADSINALTGGGGFDPLGRTRQLLGLDQLTLKQTGKDLEKTALSAGKYLSDEVYLEVEQGISPETGKASLKWEITPNVSVQTEVGVNAEAGAGINWRWDY